MAVTRRHSKRAVTRSEFAELVRVVEECYRNLEMQFPRIAQIQTELDQIRSGLDPLWWTV